MTKQEKKMAISTADINTHDIRTHCSLKAVQFCLGRVSIEIAYLYYLCISLTIG